MLILVDLSKELPSNLIPRVPAEEIAQRGKFEMITVLFPLGRRSAETVVKEIEPLMGAYGKCVGLPQTGQLLVTETAGRLQALSILIASIPEPQQPKPPEPKPEPPPPVLAVYPVTTIDPAAAVQTLQVLFPKAQFRIDDKVDQIMAYATPGEQAAIKAAVDQMQANRSPENSPRLEIYPLDLADTTDLVKQLQTVLPKIQATVDASLGRLLVFAEPKDQEQVKAIIQKLGTSADSGGKQVVVYQLKHFDPTALTTLVKQLLPRVEISSDVKLRRLVVGTSPGNQAMVKSLVEQLDQESALEDKPLLQLYPLAKRLDETVLTTLRPLVPDAQLTLSADGRQLTVVARVVDQTVVKKLVDQWQELAAAREEPALKIYTLGSMLTAADVTTLKSLVPAAEVTLATDGRQLRVVARATDQTQIESLIKELETAATAESKPGLQIYPAGQGDQSEPARDDVRAGSQRQSVRLGRHQTVDRRRATRGSGYHQEDARSDLRFGRHGEEAQAGAVSSRGNQCRAAAGSAANPGRRSDHHGGHPARSTDCLGPGRRTPGVRRRHREAQAGSTGRNEAGVAVLSIE